MSDDHPRTKMPKFDINDAELPPEIADAAMGSGGYPYEKKLKREPYEEDLVGLQIELVKMQAHLKKAYSRYSASWRRANHSAQP